MKQRSLIYFPQAATPVHGASPISFQNGEQILHGWLVNPGRSKALFYYGGNAEGVEYNVDFFIDRLPEWSVYLIPYRGYGANLGSPEEAALYADALYVYDQVSQQYQQIGLIGRSLGSGIARYVAANRQIDKLILVTPFDSLVNVASSHYPYFPVKWLLSERYASIDKAQHISAQVLVIVAEQDEIVGRERSDALVEQFNPDLVSHTVIPFAKHGDVSMYPQYEKVISDFLR